MDWQEIEDLLQDCIYVSLGVDKDDFCNLLTTELALPEEEIETLFDMIEDEVDNNRDWIKGDVAMYLTSLIHNHCMEKEAHEHPEDAPWQLHLFE